MTSASSCRVFAVLWVVSLIVWWQPIAATLRLALRQDAYTHILLILPVSAGLIAMEWSRRKWKPNPSIAAGSAVLGLAILIRIAGLSWGRFDTFSGEIRLSLQMLAVVTWWIGSFLVCFGSRIFRGCVFPLFFLLWLVPMPGLALDRVVSFLQQGTASFARLMLATAGVPVAQDHTILTVPGLTLEVAQECSSIRSSMVLVVSSMVLSYLFLHSLWGKTVVILASIPLAIAKNGLRVFTLTILAAYVNPTVLNSPLHHQGGVLFLAVAFMAVFVLIWIVGRVERRVASLPAGKQISSLSTSGNMN